MARIAVDGNYQFDSDINSLCDAVAGNGVISGLATTQKGAGANMSVDVALGVYVANGTTVSKTSTTNVIVTAAHATYPRKDIIIGDSSGNLTCVAGTQLTAAPAGNSGLQTYAPVPPDITTNKIILAEIWVPAAAATIVNAYISDKRVNIYGMGVWLAYTPTLTNMTLGDGTVTGSYCQIGKTIIAQMSFTMGSTSAMGTNPAFSLPVTAKATLGSSYTAILTDSGTATYVGWGLIINTARVDIYYLNAAGTSLIYGAITDTVPHTWAATDIITVSATYEAA